MRSRLGIILAGGAALALVATVSFAGDLYANPDDERGASQDGGEPSENGEAQEVPEENAQEWLTDATDDYQVIALNGATIYWVGYVPAGELTEERLEKLNADDLKPNFASIFFENAERAPIEIAKFASSASDEIECAALTQVVRDKTVRTEDEYLAPMLGAIRLEVPDYPLDAECKPQNPWPDSAQSTSFVTLEDGEALLSGNRLIAIDEGLRCDSFLPARNGEISVSSETKIVFGRHVNLKPRSDSQIGRASRVFSAMEFGFSKAFRDEALAAPQFLPAGYNNDNVEPLELDLYVIEERGNDRFCVVTQTKQGSSVWIDKQEINRNGNVLPWSPDVFGGRSWDARPLARKLGGDLAKDTMIE